MAIKSGCQYKPEPWPLLQDVQPFKYFLDLHIEDLWADSQDKAENKEIDGLAFGGRDPSRDVHYNATDVLIETYFSVFTRSQNEFELTCFSDLEGMRIGYKAAAGPAKSLLEKIALGHSHTL